MRNLLGVKNLLVEPCARLLTAAFRGKKTLETFKISMYHDTVLAMHNILQILIYLEQTIPTLSSFYGSLRHQFCKFLRATDDIETFTITVGSSYLL